MHHAAMSWNTGMVTRHGVTADASAMLPKRRLRTAHQALVNALRSVPGVIGTVTVRKTTPRPVSASGMVVLGTVGLPVLLGALQKYFSDVLRKYSHLPRPLLWSISSLRNFSLVL